MSTTMRPMGPPDLHPRHSLAAGLAQRLQLLLEPDADGSPPALSPLDAEAVGLDLPAVYDALGALEERAAVYREDGVDAVARAADQDRDRLRRAEARLGVLFARLAAEADPDRRAALRAKVRAELCWGPRTRAARRPAPGWRHRWHGGRATGGLRIKREWSLSGRLMWGGLGRGGWATATPRPTLGPGKPTGRVGGELILLP
ncbi:MAG: hypothetical protein C0501_30775 [Isosphaera sp.]|nr:hypothetical protein [Isosphaera sp.]